jgi:peptidoglycan/xylan/chitin deacetylase (PgdA/CDA1 family)
MCCNQKFGEIINDSTIGQIHMVAKYRGGLDSFEPSTLAVSPDLGKDAAAGSRPAFMTVDLEDYRRQELRDHVGDPQPPHPCEVSYQTELMLKLLDDVKVRATFFAVGRLGCELDPELWRQIANSHEIGCHGHEHIRVDQLGPKRFLRELYTAKSALEDRVQKRIISFRAPYFSIDGCDPWFGRSLALAGFELDCSMRIRSAPAGFEGVLPLPGSEGAVLSIPLPCLGFGDKRITVIGGTYLRLFPIQLSELLLRRGAERGFLPMVYLHPYDVDGAAKRLEYPTLRFVRGRFADRLRRMGRASVPRKMHALARSYSFRPVQTLLTRSKID